MKLWSHKLKKTKKNLRSKRGETIMEAIVSLLILGIFMTTVVSIVRYSLVMTGMALSEATAAQTGFNQLIHEDFGSPPPTSVILTFSLDLDDPFIDIVA